MATSKRSGPPKKYRAEPDPEGKECAACRRKLTVGSFYPHALYPGGLYPACCECSRLDAQQSALKVRSAVLESYGAKCLTCAEADVRALTLVFHPAIGDELKAEAGKGQARYAWAKRNNFPPALQVLCCNCSAKAAAKDAG